MWIISLERASVCNDELVDAKIDWLNTACEEEARKALIVCLRPTVPCEIEKRADDGLDLIADANCGAHVYTCSSRSWCEQYFKLNTVR